MNFTDILFLNLEVFFQQFDLVVFFFDNFYEFNGLTFEYLLEFGYLNTFLC